MESGELRKIVVTYYQERLAPNEANWDILSVCAVAYMAVKAQREQDARMAEVCSDDELAQRIAKRIREG
jgi:hypothetical protein